MMASSSSKGRPLRCWIGPPRTAREDSYGWLTKLRKRSSEMAPVFHMISGAPAPVAPYSHAVEQDGWLFITGQLATDPDDDSVLIPEGIEAQTHKVMDNLRRVLNGIGATLEHVLSVRVFLT